LTHEGIFEYFSSTNPERKELVCQNLIGAKRFTSS
jgi:hypothetical protein